MNTVPTPSTQPELSNMRLEIEEIPEAIDRLLTRSGDQIADLAETVTQIDPKFLITIARGSSDHCCGYLNYIYEIYGGRPVASLGPSVASIYHANLALEGSVSLAVSQSGKSPDIVEATRSCSQAGSCTIGLTNTAGSPLTKVCDHTIDIQAGPEISVAATKTFVNSIVAGLLLFAHWRADTDLKDELYRLPQLCSGAIQADWSALADLLVDRRSLYVLGRGPSLPIAQEMALKFKEVCQIQAEAYSAAEVLHGPVSILEPDFPVLALVSEDASKQSTLSVINQLASSSARLVSNAPIPSGLKLQTATSDNPIIDPLLHIVSFYACVERLARQKGLDPDMPPHLNKVTETV